MKKISKIFFAIALLFCMTFTLIACNSDKPAIITVDYLSFEKIDSYTMNYDGAGAGAVVSNSIFKINTQISGGKLLKYDDFSFINENGSLLDILSIEIFPYQTVFQDGIPSSVILNKNNSDGFMLESNKTLFIEIRCASGTLGGKHKINYLTTVIDEIDIVFNV